MDPEKHRHSLVLAKDESTSGCSALRASTRSPSFRRLSLRKSRSSSCSSADSVSIYSTDSHISSRSSCVTRDIPRDECAFHRFMVWVAVKRNECERMTPSERLECPLLRCRKRFVDHEQMLRHLYACNELDSGEYWCYDCERPERFTDAKCKRCLGHPTKRRRILSMAKNFFTSLGHKSRKDVLLKQLPENDVLVPPPSYDSSDLHLTNELCSAGEIHEIDSTEIPLEPLAATAPAPVPVQNPPPQPGPEPSLFLSNTVQQPACVFPAELDTRISLANLHDSAAENWINEPMAYVPSEGSDRWNSVEECRMKTRSKTLAPSSSLRSNASNSSTNTTNSSTSTNSTDTTNTVSTGFSPSICGEQWTIASGIDTELEPPISNLLCPSKFDAKDEHAGPYDSSFDGDVLMPDFVPELPADLPLLAPLPCPSDNLVDPPDILSLGVPAKKGLESAMTTYNDVGRLPDSRNNATNPSAEASSSPDPQSSFSSSVEPSSLVSSILETLQAHVSSSEAKLRIMRNNSLASQFLAMDSQEVASYGHFTLKAMLQGRPPESTLHLLCYVHVIYAYFLVLHQEEAGTHSKSIFPQALAYAAGLDIPAQSEYLEIVRAIWEPDDLGSLASLKPDSLQLVSNTNPFVKTPSSAGKGNGPSNGAFVRHDALLAVAQYLLDEFEYSILVGGASSSIEIRSSELWTTLMGGSWMSTGNTFPSFRNAIGDTVNSIAQRFGSHRGLTSALQFVSQRTSKGYIPTARRAELELLQAAHGCIPLATSVKVYAPFVRDQCDILYASQPTGMTWRYTHYGQAIDLIESMVSSIASTRNARKSPDTSDIDELLALSIPFIDASAGVSPGRAAPLDFLSPTNTAAASSKSISKAGASSVQPPSHSIRREAESTTPQSGQSGRCDTESRPAAQKVEADACCEVCGYRPKGDPQWFKGSMAKHKKLQHSAEPPKIYKCPYPGCTSQYKNRPDNLRQHKIEKGHFVDGEKVMNKRPSKRKKV